MPTARHTAGLPGHLQLPQATQKLRDPQESQGKLEEEEAARLGQETGPRSRSEATKRDRLTKPESANWPASREPPSMPSDWQADKEQGAPRPAKHNQEARQAGSILLALPRLQPQPADPPADISPHEFGVSSPGLGLYLAHKAG